MNRSEYKKYFKNGFKISKKKWLFIISKLKAMKVYHPEIIPVYNTMNLVRVLISSYQGKYRVAITYWNDREID